MKQAIRLFFILLFLLYAFSEAKAQKPVINSISKSHATVNETIVISGAHFGTVPANLRVFFGSVAGDIQSVEENLISVKVPAGATYHSIAVTNISSGLTGYSAQQFGLSFGGETFDEANFAPQQDFAAGQGLFDLCLGDFDGDGYSDVATANTQGTDIGIFKNSGTNTISFAPRQSLVLNPAAPTRNVNCGDIDGDGKPDLVASGDGSYGNTIFVFRNTSNASGTISFATPQLLTLGKNGAARVAIRDLDLDGKPELVVTNRSENKITIFSNTSTMGNISFAAAETLTINGATHSNGLAVEDLNADGLPEIIINTLQTNNIYILKNKSTSDGFSFDAPIVLETPVGLVNLVAGDLDNDNKPDIAATNVAKSNVIIFRNQSSTDIAFSSAIPYPTDPNPWGLTLGDVDGNGTSDIIVAFHLSNTLDILLNNSTPGTIAFSVENMATNENTRNIKFGDLNGDAKPDFIYTSTESNQLSVKRNKACIVPKITPEGPHNICSDTPLKLFATKGLSVTYEWKRDGVAIPGEENAFIEPDQSGHYTVTISSTIEGCSKTSTDVMVNIDATPLGPVELKPISPVCAGENIPLSATAISGATYYWTGPNDFSDTTSSNELTIPHITMANAGTYSVVINNGTCSSQPLTANAVVYALPHPEIIATGSITFCEGGSVSLFTGTNFESYQWQLDGEAISGATSSSYTATSSGNYTVKVINATGCVRQSEAIMVNEFSPPEAAFTAPEAKCVGEAINFQSTAVVEGDRAIYLWDFGDGHTSTEENPSHAFSTTGTYQVKLTVSYSSDCKSEITKSIRIIEAPAVAITAEGSTTFCEGDSVKLSVPEGFKTYIWSNGSLTPNTYAKTDGVIKVTIVTNEGCTLNPSLEINVLPYPEVNISADKTTLAPGEAVQLVASGAYSYSWEPAEGLSDPSISDPIASPDRTTEYIVTGTNNIGCSTTDTITLVVNNEFSVVPEKLFIPATEDIWKIEQMEFYSECTVTIFNKQGLKLFEKKDYTNNPWNGTYKGQPVPEGVYYFVIRCDGETNIKTGSITLMR